MPLYKHAPHINDMTSWEPNCAMNAAIQRKYKLNNSHAYRYFIQNNGDQVTQDIKNCKINSNKNCKVCPMCESALDWAPIQRKF